MSREAERGFHPALPGESHVQRTQPGESHVQPDVERWFVANTWQRPAATAAELTAAKRGRTVSVVLPALDEQATVAGVVRAVRPYLGTLVDELVVADSGSTDDTARRAAEAGARVIGLRDVLPDIDPLAGKGEVLWRSLAATSGDLVVFLDSDLVDPDPRFVPSLLEPLLTRGGVQLVKGFYRRPLRLESGEDGDGGGRVTELLARPVLAALRPELRGVVQPLGGEYAATRCFLESVPFAVGYGVEIGLLLDAHARHGLAGIAQVNLGVRKHRNRSLKQLGVMARQILATALRHCGVAAADTAFGQAGTQFTQFTQVADEWLPDVHDIVLAERPPMGGAGGALVEAGWDVPRSKA